MNVTFLIGNGFDLNLGLKTRYTDFLEYYCAQATTQRSASEKSKIIAFKELLWSDHKNWKNTWANFERELGLRTDAPPLNTRNSFQFCVEDILEHFVTYMKNEQTYIDYDSSQGKMASAFVNSLFTRRDKLDKKFHRMINVVVPTDASYTYHFLNFNYTNTLDSCIHVVQDFSNTLRMRGSYQDEIGELIHVHGALEGVIIMGVNDITQIKNQGLRPDEEFQSLIVKPRMNDLLAYDQDYGAMRLIQESNEIWVFGMSFGETDRCWWVTLGRWLKEDFSHQLVLCSRKRFKPNNLLSIHEARQSVSGVFFDRSGLSPEEQDDIASQVHICLNSDLFDLKPILFPREQTAYPSNPPMSFAVGQKELASV